MHPYYYQDSLIERASPETILEVTSRGGGSQPLAPGWPGTPPARPSDYQREARALGERALDPATHDNRGDQPTANICLYFNRRSCLGTTAFASAAPALRPNEANRPLKPKKAPAGRPAGVVSSTGHANIKERCRDGRGCEKRSCPDPGPRTERSAWPHPPAD
jgi:hypothetical protein